MTNLPARSRAAYQYCRQIRNCVMTYSPTTDITSVVIQSS
jgi:hypothetical protein